MGAVHTPCDKKLKWTPSPDFLAGRDGVNVALGRKGRYIWLFEGGLHSAYFYAPGAREPEELQEPCANGGRAYWAIVDHNKEGLDLEQQNMATIYQLKFD
jgi:hypothetical protein